jgi:hypothetical protein
MRLVRWPALLLLLLLPAGCRPLSPAGPAATATPERVTLNVYFTDSNRYAEATEPFEVAVSRTAPAGSNLPEAVLTEFFQGPTAEEARQGLVAITSGATGFRELHIDQDGIAHVTLDGPCSSMGATYTIAQPLMKNLLQFEEIDYVKIYDAEGETEVPEGRSSSIPFCLEP